MSKKKTCLFIGILIVPVVAVVAFLIATIYMFTLPLPTGFSLGSYFGA